ncbi:MAG TPA: single-stranded-DNA-specific exonuclease RecJ [Gemmatimonadaceae bacterium]|nr:single-stranded-DNA-specific exonuclease RecJ [Gemmatimonadaceae bacterium]
MTAPTDRLRQSTRWVMHDEPDAAAVNALATALHLPDAICRLLVQRGFADIAEAKRYLRPDLDQLHDPLEFAGMDVAVARLQGAIRNGERILVHGDYDVDGICSTTLLLRALRYCGGIALPFIPRRVEDGYDLTMAGVNAAVQERASLIVTCDCGTTAVEPVHAAHELGIDVIITDHHLPSSDEVLPDAVAILNAKRPGCSYPDKDLAAVGVAYKLALALARALGMSEAPIHDMLDLVALATIADIAPLRGENRILVRHGLKLMQHARNVGLRALIHAAGLEGKPLTAGRVGFILAPRLNAVGRLDHALRGVELLMTDSEEEANSIARVLEETNRRRQQLDRDTLAEAMDMAAALDMEETYGIVLAREGWHAGVIGIVASRLVEEFCRPVMLIALHDGQGKGSGRSTGGFDLHAGLTACRHLLTRYGGHKAAAGVSLAADRVTDFAAAFNAVARERLTQADFVRRVHVDLAVPLPEASEDLERLLRHFEPYGVGNPQPVFVARGVRLAAPPRVIGRQRDHLKLRLAHDDAHMDALGWGMADRARELADSATVDVAYRLERDEWNGEQRLQIKLADIRR